MRSAACLSASSPAKWPQVSTSRRCWSRSASSREWARRWLRADCTARSTSLSKLARLRSPVSGSWVARKLRSRSIERTSLTSLKASTAPIVRPSRLKIGEAESDMAIGWPVRGCSIRSPGNSTKRPSARQRVPGSSSGEKVCGSTTRKTSRRWRPYASWSGQAVSRSAAGFMNSIMPRASVRMTPSPIEASVTWARSFSWKSASSASLRLVMSSATPSRREALPPTSRITRPRWDSQRVWPFGSSSRCSKK